MTSDFADKLIFWLLLATIAISSLPVRSQQPCTFRGEKTVIDTLTPFEYLQRNYPPYTYIFQKDESDNVDWLIFCANDTVPCELYQALSTASVSLPLKYRPGQTVYIRYQNGHKSEAVRIANFDEFHSGTATFPAVVFGSTTYYYINQREFWYYLPESALYPTKE